MRVARRRPQRPTFVVYAPKHDSQTKQSDNRDYFRQKAFANIVEAIQAHPEARRSIQTQQVMLQYLQYWFWSNEKKFNTIFCSRLGENSNRIELWGQVVSEQLSTALQDAYKFAIAESNFVDEVVRMHPKLQSMTTYHVKIHKDLLAWWKEHANAINETCCHGFSRGESLQGGTRTWQEVMKKIVEDKLNGMLQPASFSRYFHSVLMASMRLKLTHHTEQVANKAFKARNKNKSLDRFKQDVFLYFSQVYKNNEVKVAKMKPDEMEAFFDKALKKLLSSSEWSDFVCVRQASLDNLAAETESNIDKKVEILNEEYDDYVSHLEKDIQKNIDQLPMESRGQYYNCDGFLFAKVIDKAENGMNLQSLSLGLPHTSQTHPKLHQAIDKYREVVKQQTLLNNEAFGKKTRLFLVAQRFYHPAMQVKIGVHRDSRAIRFLKRVAHVMNFLVSAKRILGTMKFWQSHGQAMQERSDKTLSSLFEAEENARPKMEFQAAIAA